MIPILFAANETHFANSQGIGLLTDATSCICTEERNGMFEVTLKIPTTSRFFEYIAIGNLIGVVPYKNGNVQAFEIYEISKPANRIVTVRASHISYRASFIPIMPFAATGINATFEGFSEYNLEPNPFSFYTDIDDANTIYSQSLPRSLRSCLGGSDDTLLALFGNEDAGEFLWDNYTINLLAHRGNDNGVYLRYKKNISDITQVQNGEKFLTGCVAYWVDSYNEVVKTIFKSDVQYSEYAQYFPFHRTQLVDVTHDFDLPPTLEQLNEAAYTYITNSDRSIIKDNITIEYADLKSQEFEPLERINLCDIVHVAYYPLNIEVSKKVIKTEWNVLTERYEKIELGDYVDDFTNVINDTINDFAAVVNTENRIVSVTQTINRDLGVINETVSDIQGDVDANTQNISSLNVSTQGITETVSSIQTKTDEYGTAINSLQTTVQTMPGQWQVDITSSENRTNESIGNLDDKFTTEINNITTSVIIDDNGVTVRKASDDPNNQFHVRGVFGPEELDFIDDSSGSDVTQAWIGTDGLGGREFNVGNPGNRSEQWRIITSSDGFHLRFTRHS